MPDDKIKFYNIEAEHLADLKDVARVLYAAQYPITPDEMRELAFKVMGVVNYAETLAVFQTTGSTSRVVKIWFEDGRMRHKPRTPYTTSVPFQEVTEEYVGKRFVQGGTISSFVITRSDIGKRIYNHDGVIQMESDDERAARILR